MQRFRGALFLMGAFMLAGSSVIAARILSDKLGTFTITAGSLFFVILGLFPLYPRWYKKVKLLGPRDWLLLLLQALCGIFLFRFFLLKGLLYTSTVEAGVLTGVTPAATALMARFFLKEPLNQMRVIGIGSTVLGIVLIQGALWSGSMFSQAHFAGNLLVLAAALCESTFNIASRVNTLKASAGQLSELHPAVQTVLVSGIAFLFCLLPALGENPAVSLLSLGLSEWLALIWYGLFVTALAFIFWYAGIRRCEASIAAVFSGMMPLTAMLLSILLLGEHPGWEQWIGGILVILGMLLTGLKSADKYQDIAGNHSI